MTRTAAARRTIATAGRRFRELGRRLDDTTRARLARTTPKQRRARLTVLVVLLVLAVAGAAVLGVMAQRRHEVDVARSVGLDQARQRTEQILTFDPRTAPQDVSRAREAVTGAFADQFGLLIDQLVQPSLGRGLATTTRVTDASVISAEPGRMTALLFLEQSAAAPGQQPRVQPSRARVTVTAVAGQWLISDLQSR